MTDERNYIEKCRELIESQLTWGSSASWQNQDFEELSERIFEKTKVSLSSSTLKRIWGKVKYDGSPNLATLNALAQFAGFDNWRELKKAVDGPLQATESKDEIVIKIKPKNVFRRFRWAFLAGSFMVLIGILWAFQQREKKLEYSNIRFMSKPVTLGVPNTVVFEYNAVDSNADSVFIQQSWDPKRRYRVNKNLHEYTSTYYTPGYFKAKLILNDSIVKEHDLFIESNGWLGTVEQEKIPIYIAQPQKNGVISITENDLANQNIQLKDKPVWVNLYNVSAKNVVSSDAFAFETELKNTFAKGEGVCQQSKVWLLGSDGIIAIPLSIKGCVGELYMTIADKQIDGKTQNLSAFGVDFSDWVKVKCIAQNQKIQVFINNALAYQGDYKQNIGKIVGTRIRFMGTGEVKNINLRKL
ncbi:MAG: hypothetical protein MUF45_13500 [Spirosomaceae bacterium]|jgi:hypothetical protein|nr:hypothetical protein [Spirosomataceae bacterium]